MIHRRDLLTTTASAAIGMGVTLAQTVLAQTNPSTPAHKGRLKQCVMGVNFDPQMPFEDRCREAARLGAYGGRNPLESLKPAFDILTV